MSEQSKNCHYAIVIPAYNEKATIRNVTLQCLKHCNNVIVVDDGSSDSTLTELEDIPVTLIKHDQNQGKAASLWDGFMAALNGNIEFIITLDADGQHAPDNIELLIEKNTIYPNQIIIGARLADKSAIPAKRYYANKIANFWISWAAGYPISDSQSGFRLYPRALFDNLKISTSKNNSFVFESEIIIKAAQRGILSQAVAIPAVYEENARPSHFRGVRDISLITIMVAKSLFSQALYLPGLYRSFIKPRLLPSNDNKLDYDGYLMMLFSLILMILTSGFSLLLSWIYVLQIARRLPEAVTPGSVLLVPGKQLDNNQPDQDYIARLQTASRLLNDKIVNHVYILGGKTNSCNISEASVGKNYLVQQGIATECIFVEEESHNTLENLKRFFILSNYKDQNVLLISNHYHLARCKVTAKGFTNNIQVYPAEEKFNLTLLNLFKTIKEAFYLHWYLSGKYWANISNNKRMLDRLH